MSAGKMLLARISRSQARRAGNGAACLVAVLVVLIVVPAFPSECDWVVSANVKPPGAPLGDNPYYADRETWLRIARMEVAEAKSCAGSLGFDDERAVSLFDQALGAMRDDVALALLTQGVRPRSRADAVEAAAARDLPLVLEALLDEGPPLDLSIPLHRAAFCGAYQTTRLLLTRGADPTGGRGLGVPLAAALTGAPHLHIAHMLLDHGADLTAGRRSVEGQVLHWAAYLGTFQFVAHLVAHGVDPNLPGPGGEAVGYGPDVHPLVAAAQGTGQHADGPAAIRDLRAGKATWDTLLDLGADPRAMACGLSQNSVAREYFWDQWPHWFLDTVEPHRSTCAREEPPTEPLPAGCRWLATSRTGDPYRASRPDHIRRISRDRAVACAGDLGVAAASVVSLFDQALAHRREDLATALLALGVEPRSRLEAVHFSATRDLPLVLEALLDQDSALTNAFWAAPSGPPATPLERAAEGSYRAAKVLLVHGADPNLGDPLLAAVRGNQLHLAYLLMGSGAKTADRAREDAGELIGAAAEFTQIHFLRHLVRLGIDPNLPDRSGRHALERAVHHPVLPAREDNYYYLVALGADPRTMVCALGEPGLTKVDVMRRPGGPRWFVRIVDTFRRDCPTTDGELPGVR